MEKLNSKQKHISKDTKIKTEVFENLTRLLFCSKKPDRARHYEKVNRNFEEKKAMKRFPSTKPNKKGSIIIVSHKIKWGQQTQFTAESNKFE